MIKRSIYLLLVFIMNCTSILIAQSSIEYEFENHTPSAQNISGSIEVLSDTNASNGEFVQVNTAARDEWVEYTIQIPSDDIYITSLSYKTGDSYARLVVTLNGNLVGGLVDQYSDSSTFKSQFLKSVSLNQGEYTLRFTNKSKNSSSNGYALSLDKISFETYESLKFIIDVNDKKQVIHNFAASDAWNVHFVGGYWNEDVKNKIAEWLFSTELDENGKPKGIGLSSWRFNIGAGSMEQGDESTITVKNRRAECFLNSDSTYDWEKQKGQQWFLQKAHEYGVKDFIGFSNSPPVFYTKNGKARCTSSTGSTNLKNDCYDDYAKFLTDFAEHFADEGIPFRNISPVNEPQWDWTGTSQEGSYWNDSEIAKIAGYLSDSLAARNLSTKVMISESGELDFITGADGNIAEYFGSSSPMYVGDKSNVDKLIAAHSYWSNSNNTLIVTLRKSVQKQCENYGIEYWMTEYSLLDENPGSSNWDKALWVAKIIHSDLEIANASSWSFWTSMSEESDGRYNLIKCNPVSTNNWTLGGNAQTTQLLWILGQYSRFIRPGAYHVNLIKDFAYDDIEAMNSLMVSGYYHEQDKQVVVVAINYDEIDQKISLDATGFPEGIGVKTYKPYMTTETAHFEPYPDISASEGFTLPARSITTFVGEVDSVDAVNVNSSETIPKNFVLAQNYPNPFNPTTTITYTILEAGKVTLRVYDILGKVVRTLVNEKRQAGTYEVSFNGNDLSSGIYFYKLQSNEKVITKKMMFLK